MDGLIDIGIDAKHSNEDQIAPYEYWIENYSERIGLFGGFDLNLLILKKPEVIFKTVLEKGTQYRNRARGYDWDLEIPFRVMSRLIVSWR